jgi:AhpC/TSA antioxidant enzyme
VQLHRAREEFEAAGVELVLIGQATPRHAAHFRRTMKVELPVLADEDRSSYKAAGWKVGGVGELFGPRSVGLGLARAVRSGGRIRQGRTIGHPAQLGGAMVVAPGGEVVFSHMARDASDNPPPDELLEAARASS